MQSRSLLFSLFILTGCEAPLVLDGVESSKNAPVRRTDVFLAAADNGNKSVIVGSEGVVIRADSGTDNWVRYPIESKPALIDVTNCPNGMFAVLAMEGKVFTSTDEAASWVEHKLPTPEVPQAITCNAADIVWVVGSFSTIFSSADGGATWNDHSLNEDIILSTVQFPNEQTGIISGEFGTLLVTEDGGETWEFSAPVPNEFFPLAAVFKDSKQGWVAGLSGRVYSTRDGGMNWQQENTHTNAPLFGIVLNGDNLIAVGDYGTVIHRAMKSPVDSWRALEVPVRSRFFFRVGFPVKNNKLIIAGGAGSLELVDLANVNLLNVDLD